MTAPDRPGSLSEIVGQRELVSRLRIIMRGAVARSTFPPHVLFSGPAGHGKTSLARVMADELGHGLAMVSGPMLKRGSDLVGILAAQEDLSVLFIDEIHRLPSAVEESLYEYLEDGTLSTPIGTGEKARVVTLQMAHTVVVGATTQPGALSEPLRHRFGFHGVVTPYSTTELAEIVARSWTRLGIVAEQSEALAVAERCKGVPRLALHLAARVADWAAMSGQRYVNAGMATTALQAFGIDALGLDEVDRRIIAALVANVRPMGLEQLAQMIDLDAKTIEREHEGSLVRAGWIARMSNGRIATPAAHELARSF